MFKIKGVLTLLYVLTLSVLGGAATWYVVGLFIAGSWPLYSGLIMSGLILISLLTRATKDHAKYIKPGSTTFKNYK